MTSVAIVFHSGYGHTAKQAHAVHAGAASHPGTDAALHPIDAEGNLPDPTWDALAAADAIIIGTPTYMGGPSWQFKKFADNSASINGDKGATIDYLFHLAMQHSMIWVGTGMLPANSKAATRNDVNYLGGFSGALAQSPSDASPDEAPLPGDLETARQFGARVASLAARLHA